MTQEEKQFIIKALRTGIPAIASECIAALEEVDRLSNAKQEDLNGAEKFSSLNQEIFDLTVKVIAASAPYMASEYTNAYVRAVDVCQAKFNENRKARETKEKAEAEKAQTEENTTPGKKEEAA